MHRLIDQYADWCYDKGRMRRGFVAVAGHGLVIVLGVAVAQVDHAPEWLASTLIALGIAGLLVTWFIGFHGINRAFPSLPDSPECSRKQVTR